MRQIFLDTETTGLSPDNGDRVIEIACVELFNRKTTGNNRHYYVNPGRDSHEEALKVHGITSEFLKDKPAFEAVAEDFLTYVAGADVLIHNAPFDVGFLNKELSLLGRPTFISQVGKVIDTLAMAKDLFPGKRNSLDALGGRLVVDRVGLCSGVRAKRSSKLANFCGPLIKASTALAFLLVTPGVISTITKCRTNCGYLSVRTKHVSPPNDMPTIA